MKKNKTYKFTSPEVKARFDLYTPRQKKKLLFLRQLIFETASQIKEVGTITETLKWNEPSYVSSKSRIGSAIRINRIKGKDLFALYFNCKSNLVSTFRQIYPEIFTYEGNRSIVFNLSDQVPVKELSHCISMALTYHLNKKSLNPIK